MQSVCNRYESLDVVTLPLVENDYVKDHALSGKGHEKGHDTKSDEIRNREEAIIKLLTDSPEFSISLIAKELQLSEKQVRIAMDNLKESLPGGLLFLFCTSPFGAETSILRSQNELHILEKMNFTLRNFQCSYKNELHPSELKKQAS